MSDAPAMTSGEAEEEGYETGSFDGFAGNADTGYGDALAPEMRAHYRIGYRQGYMDGQAAYRRTLE